MASVVQPRKHLVTSETGRTFGLVCSPAVTAVSDAAGVVLWMVEPCVALGDWMIQDLTVHRIACRAPSKREADAVLARVLGIRIEVTR